MQTLKIAVAVTGASGAIYARRLLQRIENLDLDLHLVWSENARTVWKLELEDENFDFKAKVWDKSDFFAPFASGSAGFDALIICPCSMGTLGRIATGISNDLITRAADVMLKERRKLICVIRETPLSLIQLKNMTAVTEAGGIVCPASPSFYSKPQNMEQAADTVIDRVMQLAGIEVKGYRWGQ